MTIKATDLNEVCFLENHLEEPLEGLEKEQSVNSAVFHHLCLQAWQVNKHSALIWGDSTMRPAVFRILRKYHRRFLDNKGREHKFMCVEVQNSLRELLEIQPTELLIVVVNADKFAHEVRKFCDDWDVMFRYTLTRVLLLSSVDLDVDIDKKTLVKDWRVQEPDVSMDFFQVHVHRLKRAREVYQKALSEVEVSRKLYDEAKETLKQVLDNEDL